VRASITDAAQNTGTITQSLKIGSATTTPVTPPVNPPGAPAKFRPDAEIRRAQHDFVGRGRYDVSRQRVTSKLKGRPAKTATFAVRMTNRGNATDRMTIRGTPRSARFTVTYLHGRKNVTAAVLHGSYRSGTLKPRQSTTLTVKVTKVERAKTGSNRTFAIRVASAHDRRKVDTVAAVVKVVRG